MRTRILGFIGVLFLGALPFLASTKTKAQETEAVSRAKRSPAQAILLRALLSEPVDRLDDRYGSSLLVAVTEHRTQISNRLVPKARSVELGYLQQRTLEQEREQASTLFEAGHFRAAYYHYWNLKNGLTKSSDPERFEVLKRLEVCARHLPWNCVTRIKDREAKFKGKRLLFFLKTSGQFGTQIDAEKYGIPKIYQEAYYQAQEFEEGKDYQGALSSYRKLKERLDTHSPAQFGLRWKIVRLLKLTNDPSSQGAYEGMLENFHELGFDVFCKKISSLQLKKELNEEGLALRAMKSNKYSEALNYVDGGRFFSKNYISIRSIAPITTSAGHTSLPPIPMSNFCNALRIRQRMLLRQSREFLPKLTKSTVGKWERVADSWVLAGQFDDATKLYQACLGHSKSGSLQFKRLASLLNSQWTAKGVDFGAFEKYVSAFDPPDVNVYRAEISYLMGRVNIRRGRLREARENFELSAKDADFELATNAQFQCALLDRRLLKLGVTEGLTASGTLPVHVTHRNLGSLKVRFYKVTEAVPLDEKNKLSFEDQARGFLTELKKRAATKDFVHGQQELSLKGDYAQINSSTQMVTVPGEGLWLLEARSKDVSVRTTAIFSACKLVQVRFPESTMLIAQTAAGQGIAGLKMYSSQKKYLGITDEAGVLITRVNFSDCKWCNGPCDFCGTCVKRRAKRVWRSSKGAETLYCTKPGLFFKSKVQMKKYSFRQRGPSLGARLYVYADRSLYRTGDTLRFKGVLRDKLEFMKRQPQSRWLVLANEMVTVKILAKDKLIFTTQCKSNEFGTFNGQFVIPQSAPRQRYKLLVSYKKASSAGEFEVRDLNKPDYTLTWTATQKGFRVFAGYAWGARVPGSELRCMVGQKEMVVKLSDIGQGEIPARHGELVTAALRLKGKVLIIKDQLYKTPKVVRNKEKQVMPGGSGDQLTKKTPAKSAVPAIKGEKPGDVVVKAFGLRYLSNTGSKRIQLELITNKAGAWTAFIALGDQRPFDFKSLRSTKRRVTVSFPVSVAYDPCLYAHVQFEQGGLKSTQSLRIPVRQALVDLVIAPDKPEYEPGDQVKVKVTAKNNASGQPVELEASLAVVDETIFSLAKDKTPDIYDFFYKDRSSRCEFHELGRASFTGEDVVVQSSLVAQLFRPVNVTRLDISMDDLSAVDAYGVGGGAAGAYGRRYGQGMLSREGGSAGTESAVDASLRWMRRHVNKKGYWSFDNYSAHCQGAPGCAGTGLNGYEVMASSQVLLSYLGNGHSHRFGTFKRQVRSGLKYLMSKQKANGSLAYDGQDYALLNHAFGTLALCEGFAMSRDFKLKKYCHKAVEFLLSAQNKQAGWGFESQNGQSNMLVTAWAILALKTAKVAGIRVPRQALDNTLTFVDSVTDLRGDVYFAKIGEPAPDFFSNRRDFIEQPQWKAMALETRLNCGQGPSYFIVKRAVKSILKSLPTKNQSKAVNYQYWYFATRALFQIGGFKWRKWCKPMQSLLIKSQGMAGCANGSWAPTGPWGPLLGRLGTTALAQATAEIYYRYERGGDIMGPEPVIRVHFPDTVYWNPSMVTDENGQARAQFRLGDTIGSYRLTARGVSKSTQLGQAREWIGVRKEFFIRLKAPKFLFKGDLCRVYADIYNYSGRPQKVDVDLVGRGFKYQSARLVNCRVLGNGVPRRVSWLVKCESGSSLTLTAKALSGLLSDAVSVSLPVKHFGERKRLYRTESIESQSEIKILVPKTAAAGSQRLKVKLQPKNSELYVVLETLQYLVQYPYGCVEQTMSRFMPGLVVAESMKELKLPIDDFVKDFDKKSVAGVKRLVNFQKKNGAWGWFSGDAPNPFMTAYVVYGLALAKQAGVPVDQAVIDRGIVYLKSSLKTIENRDLRAYICFSMTAAGEKDREPLLGLVKDQDKLSSYGLSVLALALVNSGEHQPAIDILKALEKTRVDIDERTCFKNDRWFYKYENVNVETTAYALQAFIKIDPKNPIIKRMVKWLMSVRKGHKWKTTKDSAAAILGVIKYTVATQKTLAKDRIRRAIKGDKFGYRKKFTLQLNGQKTKTIFLDLDNPLDSQFISFFDSSELKIGENRLQVSGPFGTDIGGLELGTTVSFVRKEKRMKPKSEGIKIACDWDKDEESLTVGDVVTVTVEVAGDSELSYLMVTCPIPAGARIVRGSESGTFAEFEARHDRGLFFLTKLGKGSRLFTFKLKCHFAGRYKLPASAAEMMYSPNIKGQSSSKTATIQPK
jgi:hypothetical protein